MGYGGKWRERERARELRAQAWTLQEIADELGVARGTVSVWVRDVDFTPKPRNRGAASQRPHPLHLAKLAEIDQCREEAADLIGDVSDRDLLMLALGLYAGEGSKSDGSVVFANSDPVLVVVFLRWLRTQLEVDESRLRLRVYLHADLDLDAAQQHWTAVTGIPVEQFNQPYRPIASATRRTNRHDFGCVAVVVHSKVMHRRVMALIEAVTSVLAFRDSSVGRAADC
jgi:transcriptional regulator with XRE-family HTH domain